MVKRLFIFLPAVIATAWLVFPSRAAAVTLPGTCKKWVACGRGTYYCAANRGESCKNPSFYQSSYNLSQSIRQRAKTTPPAKKGVTYKSSPATKYVWRYKYVYNDKGQRVKKWYQVRIVSAGNKR